MVKDKGAVALVTGSTRGLGRAIALDLAARGMKVCVHGRKRTRAGEDVSQEIVEAGGEGKYFPFDVADNRAVKEGIAHIRKEWGAPTVVILSLIHI